MGLLLTAYSKILAMNYQIKDGWAKFQDGVIYSPGEISLLNGLNDEEIRGAHMAKRLMYGTIVPYNKQMERL